MNGAQVVGSGSQVETCGTDGHWTPISSPFINICTPIQCGAVALNPYVQVDNNQLFSTGTTGAIINFSCPSGYAFSGATSSTCTGINNTVSLWSNLYNSNTSPTCTPLSCPLLAPITNSPNNTILSGVTGTVLSITCNQGYTPSPSGQMTCGSNSQWIPPTEPVCQANNCSTILSPPANGQVSNGGAGSTGTVVYFSCYPGYSFQNHTWRRSYCLPNSTWL